MNLVPEFVSNFHSSPVSAVCFAKFNNSDYLLSGSDCGTVAVLNLVNYRTVSSIENAHNGRIMSLHSSFSLSDRSAIVFVSHGKDGLIKFYGHSDDITKCRVLHSLNTCSVSFFKIDVISGMENEIIVAAQSAASPRTVAVHVLQDVAVDIKSRQTPAEHVGAIATAANLLRVDSKLLLLISDEAGKITVFHVVDDYSELRKLSVTSIYKDVITCMDFDCSRMTGVCASSSDTITTFNLNFNCEDCHDMLCSIEIVKQIKITNPGISTVVVRPDKRIVATGGWDHRIRLFSWKTMKPLAVLTFHNKTIEALAYPDQGIGHRKIFYLAAASSDQSISLWNLYN